MANNGYSSREEDVKALFTDFRRSAKKARLLNPDDLSDIVKGVDFKTPDALEIKLGDAAPYLDKARNCSFQAKYRTVRYGYELKLRELGTFPEKKNGPSKKAACIQSMIRMAHTLLSSPGRCNPIKG